MSKTSRVLSIMTVLLVTIGVHTVSTPVAAQTGGTKTIPVLLLEYYPLQNGRLNEQLTGMNYTYTEVKARVNQMTTETINMLRTGSIYHGYKDPAAEASLDYTIIDRKEFLTAIPRSNNQIPWNPGIYRPDYYQILSNLNICNYVENMGVKQVWMWGYHYGDIEPVESNMAGPYGDISNSERINDMPICNKTYVLYNYNYAGTSSNSVHDHMHQFEAILGYMDNTLFWEHFVRPYGSLTQTNSCGWTHMPPNTTTSYFYSGTTSTATRCEDWRPDGTGVVKNYNCNRWGCTDVGFFTWWMQNLPGKNNNLPYQGGVLRNWWDATYDFDAFLRGGRSLHTAKPGDTNRDGFVNLSDLAAILTNFGTLSDASRYDGDLDGNGAVNLSDLAILLTNFGT